MAQKYSEEFVDKHRYINVDDDWWDAVYDDFQIICETLGIELDPTEPMFSGFCSQGDGASWTGKYRAQGLHYTGLAPVYTYETAPAEIRKHAPQDEELHHIADELCLLARIYRPAYAVVKRFAGSNYVHQGNMYISEWEFYDEYDVESTPPEIADHITAALGELFGGLATWLYKQLRGEYEYLTSDESVIESLECNEIEEEEDV